MQKDNTQSLGEKRVGVSFNPSNASIVDDIKRRSADLIDLIQMMMPDPANYEDKEAFNNAMRNGRPRAISIAQTNIETACMYAVKANFL